MDFFNNIFADHFMAECCFKIFLSAAFGIILGVERSNRMHAIGIRTMLLITTSCALLGVLSYYGAENPAKALGDPTRIAAGVVIVLDYVVPALGAKKFDCSKWGVFGCMVGTIVGIFFAPFGIILGPFLGAVAGELVAGKALSAAMRGGIGALLGFLAGVVLKFAACALFAWWFVQACCA